MFQLDVKSSKSVYEQVIDKIKELVMTGVLAEGEKLPSVRELAMDAGVNPNTMQRALAELEREGVDRAKNAVAEADLVVRLFDEKDSMAEIESARATDSFRSDVPTIDVMNKCDLESAPLTDESVLRVSAVDGTGIETLLQTIVQTLIPNPPQPGDGVWLND